MHIRDTGRMLTLTEVLCTVDTIDEQSMSQIFTIAFLSYPEIPHENNVYNHNGNPPLSYFKCDTQKIDREIAKDPYCEIEDIVNGKIARSIFRDIMIVTIMTILYITNVLTLFILSNGRKSTRIY